MSNTEARQIAERRCGKSLFQPLVVKELYLKLNGFPYSRHRSKRIEKKLRKRHSPPIKIWFDEYDSLKQQLQDLTFCREARTDMADAMWYAFGAAKQPPVLR